MTPTSGAILLGLLFCSGVTWAQEKNYPLEKPGTCPLDVDWPRCPEDSMLPPAECQNDTICLGSAKCCYSGCTYRCLLPLEDKVNHCPYFDCSHCIYAKPSPYQCHDDNQCPGGERCCFYQCRMQCKPTVTVKPGQCPAHILTCTERLENATCAEDNDCPAEKKCCDQCGMTCVDVAPEHPGFCPVYVENLSCIYELNDTTICKRDADCAVGKKCCLSDTKLQCMDALPEKVGSCPITRARCSYPPPEPKCETDQNCVGEKKCCTPFCRKECTEPAPQQ
ncbi:uncharacterized protein O3C94_003695 [Discoglossus pictus]